jgi:hypothetical protein
MDDVVVRDEFRLRNKRFDMQTFWYRSLLHTTVSGTGEGADFRADRLVLSELRNQNYLQVRFDELVSGGARYSDALKLRRDSTRR